MFQKKIYPEIQIPENKNPENKYLLQFDGCSKGNPGLAGAGAVIYKNDKEIWSDSLFVSERATNNQAEYAGLILGLKAAIELQIRELHVEGDSALVIRQINGEYNVHSNNLLELYEAAKQLQENFKIITFTHIYRDKNKRADELANSAVLRLPPITNVPNLPNIL